MNVSMKYVLQSISALIFYFRLLDDQKKKQKHSWQAMHLDGALSSPLTNVLPFVLFIRPIVDEAW